MDLDGIGFVCGGEPTDHECNEDSFCYDTEEGRLFFSNMFSAQAWYNDNYKKVNAGSVACTVCGKAAIDNYFHL